MNEFVDAFKKYADFDGRARRRDYWMFILVHIGVSIALSIVDYLLGLPFGLGTLYALASLIPAIAVSIRRLHDIGKPGIWWLINFIPLIGAIWFIVLMATDSEMRDNEYGPCKKAMPTY